MSLLFAKSAEHKDSGWNKLSYKRYSWLWSPPQLVTMFSTCQIEEIPPVVQSTVNRRLLPIIGVYIVELKDLFFYSQLSNMNGKWQSSFLGRQTPQSYTHNTEYFRRQDIVIHKKNIKMNTVKINAQLWRSLAMKAYFNTDDFFFQGYIDVEGI